MVQDSCIISIKGRYDSCAVSNGDSSNHSVLNTCKILTDLTPHHYSAIAEVLVYVDIS